MKLRDVIERLWWTFVAGFLGFLLGAPYLLDMIESVGGGEVPDLSLLQRAAVAAVFAGVTNVANFLLIVARVRLSVLPNPGDGLPGLPVEPVQPPNPNP